MGRILLIVIIIVLIGGAIKLFGLNELDVCDDSDIIENLTESTWKLEGGRQAIFFNEDGTFNLTRPFNNDGVNNYSGTYSLVNDCHVLFPNAKSGSEFDGVEIRHIKLNFNTNGELSQSMGMSLEIDFASNRYTTFTLSGTTYFKEWNFPELTKSN